VTIILHVIIISNSFKFNSININLEDARNKYWVFSLNPFDNYEFYKYFFFTKLKKLKSPVIKEEIVMSKNSFDLFIVIIHVTTLVSTYWIPLDPAYL